MRSRFLAVALLLVCGAVACDDGGTAQTDSEGVLSATELDFGFVRQNETKRLSVTLSNVGRAPMKINGIERGTNLSGDFRALQWPLEVATGGSVTLQFSFGPESIGPQNGTFTIRTDSKKTPALALAVKGAGVDTNVRITPEILTFPTLEVGSRATLPITLKNEGEVSETVELLSNTTAGMFTVTLPSDDKKIALAPGASVQLPVTFEPRYAEPAGFVSTLEFQPCATCTTVTVTLKGIGIDSFVTVNPKECVEFGLVNPGSTLTKAVAIGNLGSRSLSILEATVTTGTAVFTLEPVELNPIPQDGQQLLNLTYKPTAAVSDVGSLKIVTDNPRSPNFNVCLRGTGGGPDIRVTPGAVPFGTVAVGVARQRPLRIENRGLVVPGGDPAGSRLQILDAKIILPQGSSTQQGEFSVNWGMLPLEVNANTSKTQMVDYKPVDEGADSAILELTTNDTDTPTVQIALSGSGTSLAPCQLKVYPETMLLDFGAVDPERDARLQAVIENTGADKCLIDSLQLGTGTHSSFTLIGGAVPEFFLEAGARQYITIQFDPNNQVGAFTGSLEFNISNPTDPQRKISLKGTAAKGCLLIAPDEVNFGAVSAGCASLTRTVTLFNNCAKAVSIKSLKFSADPANRFGITTAPTFPRTSTNSSPVKFDLRYVPQVPGDDRGGVYVETDERPEPYLVPLVGKAVNGGATQEDTWKQTRSPNADILMVVDNSGSMSEEQAALAANFSSFIAFANQTNIDYHIGITTTDVTTSGARGRLVPVDNSRPRILTRTTPNGTAVFQANVNVGTNGSATEEPLQAAKLALEPAMLAGDNAGFIRQDAFLSIILVTDERDSSPESFGYYYAFFTGIKGFRNANMLSISIVAQTDPTDFDYDPKLHQLANDTGGVIASIETTDWSKDLEKISLYAFGRRTRFFLTTLPADPLQIACAIDGVNVPRNQGNIVNWNYTNATNSVDFNAIAMPEPDTTLVCTYPVACIAP